MIRDPTLITKDPGATSSRSTGTSSFTLRAYNGSTSSSEDGNSNHSHITVNLFDQDFNLDKPTILKIPFLKDTLLPPEYQDREDQTSTKNKLYKGNIDDITYKDQDHYNLIIKKNEITITSFKLMLKRIYGTPDIISEERIPFDMLYTGVYFGVYETAGVAMRNLIVNKELTAPHIHSLLSKLFQDNEDDESEFYEIIFEETSLYFLANGWELGPKAWDSIPLFLIIEYVKSQQFYVPTEYDRALFIIRIIQRRLELIEKLENIDTFKKVLNENIIYCNISVDRLIELGEYQDPFNVPYINSSIIKNSIKMSFEMAEEIATTTKKYILSDSSFRKFNSGGDYFDYSGYSAILKKCPIIEKLEDLKVPPIRLSFKLFHIDPLSDTIISSEPFFYAGSYWSVGILPLQRHGKLQIVSLLSRMSEYNDKKRKFNIRKGKEILSDTENTAEATTENYNEVLSPSDTYFEEDEELIKLHRRYNICPRLCFHDKREDVNVYMVVHILYENQNELEPEWMTALMNMKPDTQEVVPAYRKDSSNSKYTKFLKFNIALGLL